MLFGKNKNKGNENSQKNTKTNAKSKKQKKKSHIKSLKMNVVAEDAFVGVMRRAIEHPDHKYVIDDNGIVYTLGLNDELLEISDIVKSDQLGIFKKCFDLSNKTLDLTKDNPFENGSITNATFAVNIPHSKNTENDVIVMLPTNATLSSLKGFDRSVDQSMEYLILTLPSDLDMNNIEDYENNYQINGYLTDGDGNKITMTLSQFENFILKRKGNTQQNTETDHMQYLLADDADDLLSQENDETNSQDELNNNNTNLDDDIINVPDDNDLLNTSSDQYDLLDDDILNQSQNSDDLLNDHYSPNTSYIDELDILPQNQTNDLNDVRIDYLDPNPTGITDLLNTDAAEDDLNQSTNTFVDDIVTTTTTYGFNIEQENQFDNQSTTQFNSINTFDTTPTFNSDNHNDVKNTESNENIVEIDIESQLLNQSSFEPIVQETYTIVTNENSPYRKIVNKAIEKAIEDVDSKFSEVQKIHFKINNNDDPHSPLTIKKKLYNDLFEEEYSITLNNIKNTVKKDIEARLSGYTSEDGFREYHSDLYNELYNKHLDSELLEEKVVEFKETVRSTYESDMQDFLRDAIRQAKISFEAENGPILDDLIANADKHVKDEQLALFNQDLSNEILSLQERDENLIQNDVLDIIDSIPNQIEKFKKIINKKTEEAQQELLLIAREESIAKKYQFPTYDIHVEKQPAVVKNDTTEIELKLKLELEKERQKSLELQEKLMALIDSKLDQQPATTIQVSQVSQDTQVVPPLTSMVQVDQLNKPNSSITSASIQQPTQQQISTNEPIKEKVTAKEDNVEIEKRQSKPKKQSFFGKLKNMFRK